MTFWSFKRLAKSSLPSAMSQTHFDMAKWGFIWLNEAAHPLLKVPVCNCISVQWPYWFLHIMLLEIPLKSKNVLFACEERLLFWFRHSTDKHSHKFTFRETTGRENTEPLSLGSYINVELDIVQLFLSRFSVA